MPESSNREYGSSAAVASREKTTTRKNGPQSQKPVKDSTEAANCRRETQKFYRQIGFYRRRFQELIQELDTLFEQVGDNCGGPQSHIEGIEANGQPPGDLREDQIKAMAYFLWESEGCPAGRDKKHWSMAIERLRRDHQDLARA